MFRARTLFVIGAGASKEVGLPVGRELANIISQTVDVRFEEVGRKHIGRGDQKLFASIRDGYKFDGNCLVRAGWLIRDGVTLANSIDDFLERHSDNNFATIYGKAAIVKTILDAEYSSKLYIKEATARNIARLNSDELDKTWYMKFIRMLGVGVNKNNVDSIFSNIKIVVFNYDRCLEHFLAHSIQQLYGLEPDHAQSIVDSAWIVHPYGSIGKLWGNRQSNPVSFGERTYPYGDAISRIKTYGEEQNDCDALDNVKTGIEDAEVICFLGFGFHEQNMALMKPSKNANNKKLRKIFASAYGYSAEDIEAISMDICDWIEGNPSLHIENHTCADLFERYSKALPRG